MALQARAFVTVGPAPLHLGRRSSGASESDFLRAASATRVGTRVPARLSALGVVGRLRALGGKSAEKADSDAYDLAVLGAGPVGVSAAIAAAELGKKVVLIDAPRFSGAIMQGEEDLSLGGPTGLFSKALRDVGKSLSVGTLRGMGISEESIWSEVQRSCLDSASLNARDRMRALEAQGVTVLQGFASFDAANSAGGPKAWSLRVRNDYGKDAASTYSNVHTNKVLVATGSKPFKPKGIPFNDPRVFDSDSINGLSFLPKSLAITGSGIIAIEYAKIFSKLGTDVTLIIRDRVPRNALMKIGLDGDIAATLITDLVRSGIVIERGAQASCFDTYGDGTCDTGLGPPRLLSEVKRKPLKITLEAVKGNKASPNIEGKILQVDAYLAAVGRVSNTEGLGLDKAGVELDEYGCAVVNGPTMETSASGVYAAGDVVGRPYLASTGVAQGAAAVAHMFRGDVARRATQQAIAMRGPEAVQAAAGPGDRTKADGSQDSLLKWFRQVSSTPTEGGSKSKGEKEKRMFESNDPFAFPVGIWSSPECSYFGLSSQQAKERGYEAAEGLALYRESLRGCVFSPDGMLKLVFDTKTGVILGVHIVGQDACELIHYGMELVRGGRTVYDVTKNMYSAVTFHELYQIAARACLDPAAARKRRRDAGAAWAELYKSTQNLRRNE